jgi:glycosyltransferase involved in cell wall biosynthesis
MNLFIPDARVGWYFPAVKTGTDFLQKNRINAIVTIGPPHTTHLVGKKLSSGFNIPHIPVFIDPWTDISYYRNLERSKIAVSIDRRLEKSVLENASAIVFVTETMKNDYANKYPQIKEKSTVLYWGYSEEDFKSLLPDPFPKEGEVEVILHSGNIFDHQNPKKFWSNVKNEINNGRNLRLVFIGTVSPGIKESIKESGLERYTNYKGFLPYKQMLNEMLNADYLLVCATEPRHVPGKLFEYLRAGKPIIAFGDGNEEVKKIINDANAGMMFNYSDGGKEFFYRNKSFETNFDNVTKFERTEITRYLSLVLNKTSV